MERETNISEGLRGQREYTAGLVKSGFDFGLVMADAFVKGMRDIGYKNTGTAVDELIDNSIQSEARKVHVVLGFDKGSKEPTKMAIVDDGHGMDPLMIRAAVTWGGTHRQNDRHGFGRYGYGLPSACVSIGTRYSVYSRVEGGDWFQVTIDLAKIEEHFRNGSHGPIVVPEAEKAEVPKWVKDYMKNDIAHGTIVVIEKIDRLSHWTTQNLRKFFLQHFGITYRNFLRQVQLFVDGIEVEPIDPLFTTPGFRFFDIDDDRAEALEPLEIEVKGRDSKESIGIIKVRYSYMPPTFLRVPEGKMKAKGGKNNPRFSVRKENNGIIVLRAGRQIDVVSSKCPWTTFQNNDRYVGVEVDFEPVFDEEFSITTSKQQVVLSQRVWDILEDNGVYQAIKQMRTRYEKDADTLKVKQDTPKEDTPRPSESAMEEAQKFIRRTPTADTSEEQAEAERNLDNEIERIAKQTGLPKEAVKQGWDAKNKGRRYRVEYVDYPDSPFYSLERIGGLRVLRINKAHPFYTDMYAAPDSTPTFRFRLDVLLFVLGDCELSATATEYKKFYASERAEWSRNLRIVLEELDEWDNKVDDAELNDEIREAEEARKAGSGGVAV